MSGPLCCVYYSNRRQFNTSGKSLFDVAAKAIHWVEVDCRSFGTSRIMDDDEVLEIGVGLIDARTYRVRVGRVREWLKEQQAQ